MIQEDPISSRYFPIASQCYLNLSQKRNILITLNRAAGVASLNYNEIEIMLHRRTLYNDNMGLSEPMDDYSTTSGQIFINFNVNSEFEKKMIEKRANHPGISIFTHKSLAAVSEVSNKDRKDSKSLLSHTCQTDMLKFSSNKLQLRYQRCSFAKNRLPPGLLLLSMNFYSNTFDSMILRLERYQNDPGSLTSLDQTSASQFKISKNSLHDYFNFNSPIISIEVLNLAGLSFSTGKKYIRDFYLIELDEILTLKLNF